MSDPQPSGLALAAAAFRQRNYRLFFVGGLISNTGRWFQTIAIPIVVYGLTESPGWVGLAGFAQIFPLAAMGPLAGALADRYPRRKILFVTQTLQAVAALGYMTLWFAGVRDVGVYVLMSFVSGAMAGLNLPAWQAFVSELVPRELLLSAITLNSAQFNGSRMIGPAVAGVAIAAWGPGWAFFVNAVSYAAVLVALALIQVPNVHTPSAERIRPVKEFVGAIRYARSKPGIRTAIATISVIGFFGLSLQTLSVVMAEEVFDRGEGGFGLMLSALGFGAVTASPAVAAASARLPRSRIQGVALVLYAIGICVLATAPVFVVALGGLFVMGAAHISSASTLNTAIQLQVDESVRAKVISVYLTVLMLANPIGQLLFGQVIELVGPRETIGGVGAAMFVIAVALVASGRLRGLDDETEPYAPGAVAEAHPSTPAPPTGYR